MVKEIHSHEWWMPYIDEYRRSGESMSDYCRAKGFRYDAFHWHVQQEKRKQSDCESIEDIVITPVTVIEHPQESLSLTVNGIDVSGSASDLRRLLGIQQ